MTGKRIRLDDDERVYLIDLVNENNRLHGSLMSLSIRRLLAKLGDDTHYPNKARVKSFSERPCTIDGCNFIAKSGAGLNRHIVSKH